MMRLITIFFLLAFIHLIGYILSIPALFLYTKPFLIPSLGLAFWISFKEYYPKHKPVITLLLCALFFSTIGDILLQLHSINSKLLYFYLGLGAFLSAHIVYSLLFNKFYPIKTRWYWLLPVVFFSILLLSILLPRLQGILRYLVIVYGLVISTMACFSFTMQGPILSKYSWAIPGALLFVISDSILAINKFHTSIPGASLFIMSTYLAAQYFIVSGIAYSIQNDHPHS